MKAGSRRVGGQRASWSLALLIGGAAWSAEPPPPAPPPTAPTAVDAITQRRAAEAAKAFTEASTPAAPLEPELAARLAEIELLVGEGASFLAAGQGLKAGDCALAAAARWNTFTLAERTAAGTRGRAVAAKLTALDRGLAGPDGLVVPAPMAAEAEPAGK